MHALAGTCLTLAAVPPPRRYSLFLEQGQQLLLSARKRKKTTSSYYVIGLDPDDLSRDSKGCFGKLKANFVGTGFSFFVAGGAKVGRQQCAAEESCWLRVHGMWLSGRRKKCRSTSVLLGSSAVHR
jgi:hypothetical protein